MFRSFKNSNQRDSERIAQKAKEGYLRPVEIREDFVDQGGKLNREIGVGLSARKPRRPNLPYHHDRKGHDYIVITDLPNPEFSSLDDRLQAGLRVTAAVVEDLVMDTPKTLKSRDR